MTELASQPTAAPTRKWKAGAIGSAVVTALVPVLYPAIIAGLEAHDPSIAAIAGPVIVALLAALGFAVPAYVVKNKSPSAADAAAIAADILRK